MYGGTLRVISNTGPGTLDPVPTYNYAGYELERGYARQLVTYPTTSPAAATGTAWAAATTLVPDVAAQVPSVANGGITDGGLVYTYHIRPGVDWNSSPPSVIPPLATLGTCAAASGTSVVAVAQAAPVAVAGDVVGYVTNCRV